MIYSDKISKTFLDGSTHLRPGTSRWTEIDDQTYLGFWIYLEQPNVQRNNVDRDYLPQGLFLKEGDASVNSNYSDSAISYLKRRNEPYRAAMIEEFQEGFKKLVLDAPWVFQTIAGLDSLWKILPGNSVRLKDAKLTISCLESYDLKMSYLLDLYRKAAFDSKYMRWMLPDVQRRFTMNIIVSDIRTMTGDDGGPLNSNTFFMFHCEDCEIDPWSVAPGYLSTVSSAGVGEAAKIDFTIKVGNVSERNTYGLLGAVLTDTRRWYDRNDAHRRDVFTNETTQADATGEGVDEMSQAFHVLRNETFPVDEVSRAVITQGGAAYISAQQAYINQLFDAITDLTLDAISPLGAQQDINPPQVDENVLVTDEDLGRPDGFEEEASAAAENLERPGQFAEASSTPSPQLENVYGRRLGVGLSLLADAIKGAVAGGYLGNVYGFSPANLVGSLQGLLTNPVAAVQAFLSTGGASQKAKSGLLGKVKLTAVEIKLVKSLLGKAEEVSKTVAGTKLEKMTLGAIIKAVEAGKNLKGKPAKEPLSGPKLPTSIDPVKLVLNSAKSSLDGKGGNVVLSGPDIKIVGSLGKVDLI